MSRLFVAVWPDDATAARLARLPRPELAGLRWTAAEKLHVTLRFLGRADAAEVQARLDESAWPRATVQLGPRVSRLGRGVVMLPAAGLDALAALAERVTEGLSVPSERRSFVGHLTLGRSRGTVPAAAVGTPFDARFDVDEMTLVDSETAAGGARYRIIARWPIS